MTTPIPDSYKREDVLRNLAKARTRERAKAIADAAHEAGLITRLDLMRAVMGAKKLPSAKALNRWDIGGPAGDDWTHEEDQLLKELVQRGDSFASIANHYVDRTRDACLGRAHRLGLRHPDGSRT